MPNDERTPLLAHNNFWDFSDRSSDDLHAQFCQLVGIPPTDVEDSEHIPIGSKTLYARAMKTKRHQNATYLFTAALSNTLLLAQVVIGAALTALGASESSHVLITIFGVLNTVIAGVVAYLKSRGQPMRARMYRDDLERVVDEIENSEIMWRETAAGISRNMHGYDDINTASEVTVRSEVARLTRLYDRAVRSNTVNNPDMYMASGGFDASQAGLKSHNISILPAAPVPELPPPPAGTSAAPTTAPVILDPDDSPATAAPKPPKDSKTDDSKAVGDAAKPADNGKAATEPPKDPDASPATGDPKPSATTSASELSKTENGANHT